MERLKLATTWLGGCSGCHMSFLDLDEFLLDLADKADVVYSPVVDAKEFPDGVDVTLIEGAVAEDEHLELVKKIRARSKVVVSFGDCAVTGNVTSLRNPLGGADVVLRRSYLELATINPQVPSEAHVVPRLLDRVVPVHYVIPVDYYLPGCPPPADRIRAVLEAVLAGKQPHLDVPERRFG
jgi:NAD-reducing hydrogenase small subunit